MSQSDSDFIEQEARREDVRQRTIEHILIQNRSEMAALSSLLVLPEECTSVAAVLEDYAAQLRCRADHLKSI
jgi:hypothetical protein